PPHRLRRTTPPPLFWYIRERIVTVFRAFHRPFPRLSPTPGVPRPPRKDPKASSESSFAIVFKADFEGLRNPVQDSPEELSARSDFKGGKSSLEMDKETVTLVSDDEFKLGQLRDIFENKLIKRGLTPKMVKYSNPEPAAKMTVRQVASFQKGIAQEDAKKI